MEPAACSAEFLHVHDVGDTERTTIYKHVFIHIARCYMLLMALRRTLYTHTLTSAERIYRNNIGTFAEYNLSPWQTGHFSVRTLICSALGRDE